MNAYEAPELKLISHNFGAFIWKSTYFIKPVVTFQANLLALQFRSLLFFSSSIYALVQDKMSSLMTAWSLFSKHNGNGNKVSNLQ